MDTIRVTDQGDALRIDLYMPGQPAAVLRCGTSEQPLDAYLPIKVLPLDRDGAGRYRMPKSLLASMPATHIWASPADGTQRPAAVPVSPEAAECRPVPRLRFYAISDIHTLAKKGKQLRLQANAYEHIANAKADFVLIAGDIANGAQADEYAICARQIETYLPDIPVLISFGNHDFHAGEAPDAPEQQGRLGFQAWVDQRNRRYGVCIDSFDAYSYCTCIRGITIAALQGQAYRGDVYAIGDEVLPWLDKTLSARSGTPRIVFSHFPLTEYDGRIYLRENTRLRRLLEGYHDVFYFAGHTHDSLDSDLPSIVLRGSATYVNTASVGNTEPCFREMRELKALRDKERRPALEAYFRRRSMGVCVEVYDSYVLLRGVDFTQNQFIPRCTRKIQRYRPAP